MTLRSIFCLSRFLEGGAGSGRKPSKSVEQSKSEQDSARAAWKSAQSATNRAINKADDHPEDKGLLAKANAAINKSNAAGEKFNNAADAHVANINDHIAYLKGMSQTKESAGPEKEDIKVSNWFYGAANRLARVSSTGGPISYESKTPKAPKSPKTPKPKVSKPAHTKIHHPAHPILAEACARVLGRTNSKPKECISSTTNTANLVKSKETNLKISAVKFLEASASRIENTTKFRVVLLEEGLGNLNDAYYYTRDALDSAVDIFNGLKIFADHPSLEEEEIRPERSTRDILGHYENVSVEDGDQGRAWLCGDVNIMDTEDCEWARGLMVRAIENAKKYGE